MHNVGENPDCRYWRRPWHKWIILTVAILQLLFLWMEIREREELFTAGIFSAPTWESYAARSNFSCAVHGLTAALFLGVFLIGLLAGSRRSARLAEGLLLLLLALAWGTAGATLGLASQDGGKLLWAFFLLLTLGAGVYDLWKCRKQE